MAPRQLEATLEAPAGRHAQGGRSQEGRGAQARHDEAARGGGGMRADGAGGVMSRITKIDLRSWKGIDREIELSPLTLITGPNGAGKSATIEGLLYALTGDTPTGRSGDIVARYVGPRGGSVTVTDAEGRFLRRGVEIDHESHKVSEVFECSEGSAESWACDPFVLSTADFLGLSPE